MGVIVGPEVGSIIGGVGVASTLGVSELVTIGVGVTIGGVVPTEVGDGDAVGSTDTLLVGAAVIDATIGTDVVGVGSIGEVGVGENT